MDKTLYFLSVYEDASKYLWENWSKIEVYFKVCFKSVRLKMERCMWIKAVTVAVEDEVGVFKIYYVKILIES